MVGSEEEVNDLREAYARCEGSVDGILAEIPHSTYEDEARFVEILKPLIKGGGLPKFKTWEKDVKDAKGKERRRKEGEREAKQAEEHAKELGVWEEFYGSGKVGPRKAKGKGKAADDDGDTSALQALILKRQKNRGDIFDNLLAKYEGGEDEDGGKKKKGSKRKAKQDVEEEEAEEVNPSPRKKAKSSAPSGGKTASRKKSTKAR